MNEEERSCYESIAPPHDVMARIRLIERVQSDIYKKEFLPMRDDVTLIKASQAERTRVGDARYAEELASRQRIEHALFNEENGLIYIRDWLCRLSRTAVKITAWIGAALVGSAALAHYLHQLGVF